MEMLGRVLGLSQQKYKSITLDSAELSGVSVVLTSAAQKILFSYKQLNGKYEAGGMLFGRFDGNKVNVESVSTPSRHDKRFPTAFAWHKNSANRVIHSFHKKGQHYLGDWHTHPYSMPSPSEEDISSIRSTFNESSHQLNFFILFILSNSDLKNSYAALTDGKREYRLYVKL